MQITHPDFYRAQKTPAIFWELPKVIKNMKSNLSKQTTLPWPVKYMKAGTMGGGWGEEDKLITVQYTRAKYSTIWQLFLHEDRTQKQCIIELVLRYWLALWVSIKIINHAKITVAHFTRSVSLSSKNQLLNVGTYWNLKIKVPTCPVQYKVLLYALYWEQGNIRNSTS